MGKTRTILIRESKRRKIELAVNPSEVTISESLNNQTMVLEEIGTVNIPGSRGLKGIQINTFLPAYRSHFYDGDDPESILKLADRWKKNRTVLRVIISGTGINMKVLMDQASETYHEGQEDVTVSWSFSQFKDISIPTVQSIAGLINVSDPALQPRAEESAPASGKTEKVTSKTTLWALAVKHYGDGTQWTKISAANGNIDPKKLQVGMELVIP